MREFRADGVKKTFELQRQIKLSTSNIDGFRSRSNLMKNFRNKSFEKDEHMARR